MSRHSNPFRGDNVVHRIQLPAPSEQPAASLPAGAELAAELARLQRAVAKRADGLDSDGAAAVAPQVGLSKEAAYRQKMAALEQKIALLESSLKARQGNRRTPQPAASERVRGEPTPVLPVRMLEPLPPEPAGESGGVDRRQEMLGQIFSANLRLKAELATYRSMAE